MAEKELRWWSLHRARPDVYPLIPRYLWTQWYKKYVPERHPLQKGVDNWDRGFLKRFKGAFARAWRRHALNVGYAMLDLKYVPNILTYEPGQRGDEDVAGYYAGYVMCWVEGNIYGVPVVEGWPDFGRADHVPGFYNNDGYWKADQLDQCTKWALEEERNCWRVSPSLWKKEGADRIHFNLRIFGVPDPPPWRGEIPRHEAPKWESFLPRLWKRKSEDAPKSIYDDGMGGDMIEWD